ncbi:unnamed protein product, partial [Ectocarpus sp. 12 AP-2014]
MGLACHRCSSTKWAYGTRDANGTRFGPVACVKDKIKGMINLKSNRCRGSNCSRNPGFGFKEGKREFCKAHSTAGMINLQRRICATEGCTATANYGIPRKYCQPHWENSETVQAETSAITAEIGGSDGVLSVVQSAQVLWAVASASEAAAGRNSGHPGPAVERDGKEDEGGVRQTQASAVEESTAAEPVDESTTAENVLQPAVDESTAETNVMQPAVDGPTAAA